MKRLIYIAMSFAVIGSLIGCQGQKQTSSSSVSVNDNKSESNSFTIRCSHAMAEGTPNAEGWNKFEEVLEEITDGRIQVEIYGNAQLGSDREIIEAVQMGNLEMGSPVTTTLASFVNDFYLFEVPFLFDTREQYRAFWDVPEINDYFDGKLQEIGLKKVSAWENGFRHLTANKKITTPDKMNGLKVRTMENEIHLELWRALGANPTPISFSEVYTALQQKTVDAQENPYTLIYNQKFYEVQKYLMETGHIYIGMVNITNLNWWNSLSDEDQKYIMEAMKQAEDHAYKFAAETELGYREELSQYLEIVELTDEERAQFKDVLDKADIKSLCIEKSNAEDFADTFYKTVEAVAK